MSDFDTSFDEARAKLKEAYSKAADDAARQQIQADLDQLVDLKEAYDFEEFKSEAAALNALPDKLDQVIKDIHLDIDNFLLNDLFKLKNDVAAKAGAPAPGANTGAAGSVPTPAAAPSPATDLATHFSAIEVSIDPLRQSHTLFSGGVSWKLTSKGLSIDDADPQGTGGAPQTVKRVWSDFRKEIVDSAERYSVPVELIISTICTESSGKAQAIRFEPKYVSDQQTPDQVSPGLMQTLISTARSALHNSAIDRSWLFAPANSIRAGTAYIRSQYERTGFDPPLVACAYNAGGVYQNQSTGNRWRLKQYPLGTSAHADRFVLWFNDCFRYFEATKDAPSQSFYRMLNPQQ